MPRQDVTEGAHLLLRAVKATKNRYGLNMPIDVLMGKSNARIKDQGFQNVEVHAAGKHRSEMYWKAIGNALVAESLLEARSSGKGFGKKGMQSVYSVSGLGDKMLTGDYVCPVFVDFEAYAEDVEGERAARAAKKAKKSGRGAVAVKIDAQPQKAPLQVSGAPPVTPQGRRRGRPPGKTRGTNDTTPTLDSADKSGAVQNAGSQVYANSKQFETMPSLMCRDPSMHPPQVEPAMQTCSTVPQQSFVETATVPLPPKLDAALLPFQRAGVSHALQRNGRILIGDDMGLGKTIQGIAVCAAFRKEWPALIVLPNSVRLVWADELERWIPDIGPAGVNLVKSGQDLFGFQKAGVCFHIVTYGILTRPSAVRDYLREHHFKILVVDESHMMKNKAASRTQEILKLVKHASRVVLLSGTPALARPIELYTQVEAVQPGLLGSYSNFTNRYCDPKWTPFGMDLTGASNLDELHTLLRPIMVRRLKKDVLAELPSKRRQRVRIEVAAESLAGLAAIRQESESLEEQQRHEKRRLLMEMFKVTSEAKIEPACEYVEDLIHGGCKFLVFGHHLAMLDGLEAAAVRAKVKYIRIDGGVNSAERMRRVSEFQSDAQVRVAILGILAAGVGLTLTEASTVVFAELHWTPGVLVQAEDRAHRIGQKSSVNIHYLVAAGTVDDIIWPCVAHKVEVVSAICDGRKDHLVAHLTSTDRAMNVAGVSKEMKSSNEIGDALDEEGEGLLAAAEVTAPPAATRGDSNEKGVKNASAYSVLSLLQGKRPAQRRDRWICGSCSVRNDAGAKVCSTCHTARKELSCSDALPRRFAPATSSGSKATSATEGVDLIESASEPEDEKPSVSAVSPTSVHGFVISHATGRVHVMDAGGAPLGCNFKVEDWDGLRASGELPRDAVDETSRFLSEWAALKPTEQRLLVAQTLHLPLRAALQVSKASTTRMRKRVHSSIDESGAGGAVAGNERNAGENFIDDIQTCAWCAGPLPSGAEVGSCCSAACKEKHSVKIDHAAIRWQLFAVERGICQVCKLDAHALFERLKTMEPPKRHQEFLRVGIKATQMMIHRPNEGQFWQADHIVPVSEGGGECDLANFRTLCTTCHAKETKDLNSRLKLARWGKDSRDVRKFLSAPEVAVIDID